MTQLGDRSREDDRDRIDPKLTHRDADRIRRDDRIHCFDALWHDEPFLVVGIRSIRVASDSRMRQKPRCARRESYESSVNARRDGPYCLEVFVTLMTRMTRSALSGGGAWSALPYLCLLYTSDAAD